MEIKHIIQSIEDAATRYGLTILHLDATDVTVVARVGFSDEIFMQIYANIKKQKKNLALVIAGDRVYCVDNEGGFYHEHPFGNASSHIEVEEISIDTFVGNSLQHLSAIGWLSEEV